MFVILPNEIILKILYHYGGLEHKSALCIKEYINTDLKKCFVCDKTNVSLSLCDKNDINHRDILEIKKYIMEKKGLNNIYLCFSCAH